MAEQTCPTCGCVIGAEAYERDGIMFCCEPCAEGGDCECGCCGAVKEVEQEQTQ